MQAKMNKPNNVEDITKHLGDVNYPVTGKKFMEACDNMSDVGEKQRDWVKMNIDADKTYNSLDEIKKALKL